MVASESTSQHPSTSGGCPVKHGSSGGSGQPSASSPWAIRSWFKSSPNSANIVAETNSNVNTNSSSSSSISGCPVVGGSNSAIPASIENAARHAQTPQPDQMIPLSTRRSISTIPKPNEESENNTNVGIQKAPAHQPEESSKWVYPSEQQFFNAMKRKGWDIPAGMETTIPHVVQIHNAVNERGWRQVLEWERLRENESPRLVKFIGRPKDLSPRARLYSMFWMRDEPFDRHDWYVDRGDGTDLRRYVIDFYNGKEDKVVAPVNPNTSQEKGMGNRAAAGVGLPTMYLDVRPAIDDIDSVQDSIKMFAKDTFPGIYGLISSYSKSGSGK
jgi:cytochrome c heme-lyase